MWSPACIFFFYFSNQKILTPIQSGAAEPAYSTSPSLKAWEGHKAFRHWVCMTNNSNSTFVILVTIISRRYFADLHPATSSRARRTAWMTSRKPSKSFTRTEGGICRSMTANSTRAGTTSCVLYLHLKHVYLLLPCTKKKKKICVYVSLLHIAAITTAETTTTSSLLCSAVLLHLQPR
jgi:hypothetical protein